MTIVNMTINMAVVYTSEYPPFFVTVDLVVLTVRRGKVQVLLVQRGQAPYAGQLALPGGFVGIDEDLEPAAYRELAEETGVGRGDVVLEQLGAYGAPERDPRYRVVSVAWMALGADLPLLRAGTDAADAVWKPVTSALRANLAFDHRRILKDGVERARAKLEYSPLATAFCEPEFTVGELRAVYEAVWGTEIDPRNFHRKVTGAAGFLAETGETTTRGGGRPARLYRRGTADTINPPISRA